jgi:hypothetical protein
MIDLVSLREDICRALFVDAIDLSVAADAGTALEETWKVAERLAGTG